MLFRACAYCDHPNPVGTNFCNDCGAALHLQPCRQCGAVSVIKARHCPSCKAPFPERPLIDVSIPWAGEPSGQPVKSARTLTPPGLGPMTPTGPTAHHASTPPPTARRSGPGVSRPQPRPPSLDTGLPGAVDQPDQPPRMPPSGRRQTGSREAAPPTAGRGRSSAGPDAAGEMPAAGLRPQAEAAAFTRRLLEKASQSSLLGTDPEASGPRDELIIPPPSSRPRPTYPSTPDPVPEPGTDLVLVPLGRGHPKHVLRPPTYPEAPQAARSGGSGRKGPRPSPARLAGWRTLAIVAVLAAAGIAWWVLEQELAPQLRLPGMAPESTRPAPATDAGAATPPASGAPGPGVPEASTSAPSTTPAAATAPTTMPATAETSSQTAVSSPAAASQPAPTNGTPPGSAALEPSTTTDTIAPSADDKCQPALRALGLCDAPPLRNPSRP